MGSRSDCRAEVCSACARSEIDSAITPRPLIGGCIRCFQRHVGGNGGRRTADERQCRRNETGLHRSVRRRARFEEWIGHRVPRVYERMLCVLARRRPLARWCSEFGLAAKWKSLAKTRAKQRLLRPRAVTRPAEDLGDLLSNAREGGGGRVYPRPTALRRFRHTRDGRRQAAPRLPRDGIRRNRKCNACSRNDAGPPAGCPARLGCRGDKARNPAPRIGLRCQRESTERDNKALRCNGVGDDDADQRPPQPFRHHARFDFPPAHSSKPITIGARSESLFETLQRVGLH